MHKAVLLFFLILPVLVPTGMVIHHLSDSGTEWEIPVRGYDPRDLLRGRYIRFQYDFNLQNRRQDCYGDCVICLTGDKQSFEAKFVEKRNVKSCTSWINNSEIRNSTPQRFYIPESVADKADVLMRTESDNITALISVKNGRSSLKTLLINDKNIIEYIRDESVE